MNQIAAAGTGLSFARWADSATLADTITVLGDQPSMASAVDGRHPTVEPLFPPAPAALTTFVWSIAKWIVVSPEESTPVTTCPARTRGATTAYPADFNHSRVVHVDDSLLRRAATCKVGEVVARTEHWPTRLDQDRAHCRWWSLVSDVHLGAALQEA